MSACFILLHFDVSRWLMVVSCNRHFNDSETRRRHLTNKQTSLIAALVNNFSREICISPTEFWTLLPNAGFILALFLCPPARKTLWTTCAASRLDTTTTFDKPTHFKTNLFAGPCIWKVNYPQNNHGNPIGNKTWVINIDTHLLEKLTNFPPPPILEFYLL